MFKQFLLAIVLGASAGVASAQQWGDLDGTFVYKGTPPAPMKITPEKDPEYCGKHPLVVENLVVNKENGGMANVVIYLFTAQGAKVEVHPDYAKTAKDEVRVDNHNCRFEPHVQGIRTGQTLVVGNKDPIAHNTKGEFFANNPFNDLIPANNDIKKTFMTAETTPSELSCSIHPWMKAYLLIRDNPYFAVSDKDGKFSIKNLPAGEHTFIVWSNKYITDVAIAGKPTTWTRGRPKFTIKSGPNALGKIEVVVK